MKSKRKEVREELRKGSGKSKRNYAKEKHDELVEKIKMRQRRDFPFLRESKKEEDVDEDDTEEKRNDRN